MCSLEALFAAKLRHVMQRHSHLSKRRLDHFFTPCIVLRVDDWDRWCSIRREGCYALPGTAMCVCGAHGTLIDDCNNEKNTMEAHTAMERASI